MSTISYHPLHFDSSRCLGRRSCLRVCPTQAVRIRAGHAELVEDRCIDCGECIKVCERNAIRPVTHSLDLLSGFAHTVAIPSPALYTQFDAPPAVVTRALIHCGFADVASASAACEEATVAIEIYIAENSDKWPLISSECPTVVRLVQARYPALLDALLPLLPPREITARRAKAAAAARTGLSPERIGAVYLTPCPSKMVSIVDHPGMRHSHLDAAVSIGDVFPLLTRDIKRGAGADDVQGVTESASGLRWAWIGGHTSWLSDENCLSVAGLANVIRILDDVEEGRLRHYAYIDAVACAEGCVSGPLMVENPYVARARAIRLSHTLPDVPIERTAAVARYRAGELYADKKFEPKPSRPLDDDLDQAIVKMNKRDHLLAVLPAIDCGACGAPTCAAFADDVAIGTAQMTDCVFLYWDLLEAKESKTMNVAEVADRLEGKLVAGKRRANEIVRGGYASDLLSDVMANARVGDLWVTLQRHANIVAVAAVRELAGIVLIGGREPEPAALERAEEENVPIIVTPLAAFEVIGLLYRSGLTGRRD